MHATGTQQVSTGHFFMKFLGCHNDTNISTHEHSRKKNQSLSHHGHHTTKKPVESNNFSDHKSPIVTLTYPKGGFWSIFFTKLSGYLSDT